MTILHIITRLIVGGAQENTVASCAAQVAGEHDVTLAFGPIYGPEGSLLPEARATGARLVEIASMRRAVLPFHDVSSYRALRRLVRRVRPDVVHTHSSKAGVVGRAAAWAEHVPAVIHTIHGLPFHDRQPALVRNAYIAAERWAARRCHVLIGVTQASCDAFQVKGIGQASQFTVVPSGVDLSAFSSPTPGKRAQVRREMGIPDQAPVVGLVARLDPLKGQDDLLDAVPTLQQRHPELRVVFVGDGWHRAALEARVRNEGLAGRVIFTGLVSPARVGALLGAMDINTLPSYQEGQPRTLVQSLLCGCAIVAYDSGGIGEVCIDGQTGRLVRAGDRTALAGAIGWLLDRPEKRRALAESGRTLAAQKFDVRVMTRRLQEIYERALGEGAGFRVQGSGYRVRGSRMRDA